MDLNTTFTVATAPARRSKFWDAGEISWGDVLGWMEHPARRKEAGNYLFGTLSGQTRGRHTIMTRSVLTLDVDAPGDGFTDRLDLTVPYELILHTTFSSRAGAPRYRVLIPLSREVSPEEYEALADIIMSRVGLESFDAGSREASRYMFKPAASDPEDYEWDRIPGDPLDVDLELQDWDRDLSRRSTPRTRKRDPLSLAGAVGAFNRVYDDLPKLVEAYGLPYEVSGDRWRFKGAEAEAGMGEMSPGLYYSHHASDPAGKQTCTAFDLVRLHRFADLDDDVEETTPVHSRPSQEAMLDLAMQDEDVVREMTSNDFDDLARGASGQGDDHQWRDLLSYSPRTGKLKDEVGNWDIIKDHDPGFTGLYYNELNMAIEAREDLPWRPLARGGETFTSTDRAALCLHIERSYRVRPARSLVDDLVDVKAQENRINPLKDYLLNLTWDGVERVEDCLPGVEPTPYTRLVARKCLTAAVARALDPGVKWDHTLVLYGSEGRGKSHWIERMSQGYSATLGPINNKDTLLAMQRSWIMVADEGYSLRKADSDAQKEFLTRTEDVFRVPYEREAAAHPRHCVIWSTTNDEVFLRRQAGNRRFLIVHSRGKVDFETFTQDYIDQIWAEAVQLYKDGEQLFLTDAEEQLAHSTRDQYTEEDALLGVVQNWIEQGVPGDWAERSSASRVSWAESRDRGLADPGVSQINQVCSAEIWVEVMRGQWGQHSRTDLLEITKVLKRMPGWVQLPGRRNVPGYGTQMVFVREDQSIL